MKKVTLSISGTKLAAELADMLSLSGLQTTVTIKYGLSGIFSSSSVEFLVQDEVISEASA